MGYDASSPSTLSLENGESGARKRVCKACDRCRLKKSKCDGNSPCSRCKADNAICQFGERKKSLDKVYPKGYVELLEQHLTQTVDGLRILYRLANEGHAWPGAALPIQRDGHPLTHDILQSLDVLKRSPDCSIEFNGYEESPEKILEALSREMRQALKASHSPSSEDEPLTPQLGQNIFPTSFAMSPATMTTTTTTTNSNTTKPRKRSSLIPPEQRPRFAPGSFAAKQEQLSPDRKYPIPHSIPPNKVGTEPMMLDTLQMKYETLANNGNPMNQGIPVAGMGFDNLPNGMVAYAPTYDMSSMAINNYWCTKTGLTPADVNWDAWLD